MAGAISIVTGIALMIGCGGTPVDSTVNSTQPTPQPAGVLRVSPDKLDFGTVAAGATSSPQAITVSNIGVVTVTVQSAGLDTPAPYATTGFAGPTTLGPGQSARLLVTFSPLAPVRYDANLSLTSTTGKAAVALTGTGLASPPAANEPESPRAFVDSSYPQLPPGHHLLTVGAAGQSGPNGVYRYQDLQAAIDAANPGDEVAIQAGYVVSIPIGASIRLPKKANPAAAWIVIRTENLAGTPAVAAVIPAAGTRVAPADQAAMPVLRKTGVEPAVMTDPSANFYRLVGLNITLDVNTNLNYGLVSLGDGGVDQNSSDLIPHHIVIDRCYIHGHSRADQQRIVALNSASSAVVDSYLSEAHIQGADTQAIAGWNGPGPFKIVNNYLQAAGEVVMFGGADPSVPSLVPSDIEIRHNLIQKDPAWRAALTVAPAISSVTGARSGSLGANNTFYRVVAVSTFASNSSSFSDVSAELSGATGVGGGGLTVTWVSPTAYTASAFRVYRTQVQPSGDRADAWSYFEISPATAGCVSPGSTCTFADTGSSPTAASVAMTCCTRWSVKNLLELKNSQRIWVDGNILEYNWVDAQAGFALMLTPRNQSGRCQWCVVQDLTFTNNIVRHTAAFIDITGHDDENVQYPVTQRVKIANNLFYDDDAASWGSNGVGIVLIGGGYPGVTVGPGPQYVALVHNTFDATQLAVGLEAYSLPNITIANNLWGLTTYGVCGTGYGEGNSSIDHYLASPDIRRNVIVGRPPELYSSYPDQAFPLTVAEVGFLNYANRLLDYHNLALSSLSAYKTYATDGGAAGADIAAIDQALKP